MLLLVFVCLVVFLVVWLVGWLVDVVCIAVWCICVAFFMYSRVRVFVCLFGLFVWLVGWLTLFALLFVCLFGLFGLFVCLVGNHTATKSEQAHICRRAV